MDRKCLFGGAMLAAGLASASASAQDFSFTYSYALVTAYDSVDHTPSDLQFVMGPGFISGGVSNAAGSANVAFNPQSITMDATSLGANYVAGGLTVFSDFSPTADTTLDISWDFSGDVDPNDQWVDSILQIFDPGSNLVFQADLSNPVGNAQLPVSAGVGDYTLVGTTLAFGGNGTSSYSVVIPAPAGGVLLALGGLLAARRRR